jgi:hypothetical protein
VAVAQLETLGIMAPRVTISIAGVVALVLCFVSMRDASHNPAIRSSEPTMTILWILAALIFVSGVLALIRSSRVATIFSLLASGVGVLFSLILACV